MQHGEGVYEASQRRVALSCDVSAAWERQRSRQRALDTRAPLAARVGDHLVRVRVRLGLGKG